MSKLRKVLAWFRDAVPPLGHDRAARTVRAVTKRAIMVDDALRAPHYYVLDYQGRSKPKAFKGPFDNLAAAKAYVRDDIKKYGAGTHKIRRLTSGQFEELWGAPPHPDGDRRSHRGR